MEDILIVNISSWKIKTRSFASSGKVLALDHEKIMRSVKTYILNINVIPWSMHVKLHISMKDARVNSRLNISHFIVAPLTQLNNRRREKKKTPLVPLRVGRRRRWPGSLAPSAQSFILMTLKKNIIYHNYVTYMKDEQHLTRLRLCCCRSVIGPEGTDK